MPIVYHQLTPANAAVVGYAVAKELARQVVAHFEAVRGLGVGIANGSCCAALSVVPAAGAGFGAAQPLVGFGPAPGVLPAWGAPALPYAIVFGNSQIAAGGLAAGAIGGHAERAALTAAVGGAGAAGLALYHPIANQGVLFVELMACVPCQTWLNGGGGGVANPYNGVINGAGLTTLNVWWKWPYPGAGGVAAMNAFHAQNATLQLADVNATW
jgi:hypothetical protein